jgi:DNA-binding XRE family transcriptional regulator
VPQVALTITYRFAPPGEPEPMLLPLTHALTGDTDAPDSAQTIGDRLRRRRLELGFLQRQVAEQLGVHWGTVHQWEKNRSPPRPQHMPAVMRFLGEPSTARVSAQADGGRRLVEGRRARGGRSRKRRCVGCSAVHFGPLGAW